MLNCLVRIVLCFGFSFVLGLFGFELVGCVILEIVSLCWFYCFTEWLCCLVTYLGIVEVFRMFVGLRYGGWFILLNMFA